MAPPARSPEPGRMPGHGLQSLCGSADDLQDGISHQGLMKCYQLNRMTVKTNIHSAEP